jgi:hypothetical protein
VRPHLCLKSEETCVEIGLKEGDHGAIWSHIFSSIIPESVSLHTLQNEKISFLETNLNDSRRIGRLWKKREAVITCTVR